MSRYRKRPIEIEAIRWDGTNFEEIKGLAQTDGLRSTMLDKILVPTLEGVMRADCGDWIVKGPFGEVYPVKDHIFRDTYESV